MWRKRGSAPQGDGWESTSVTWRSTMSSDRSWRKRRCWMKRPVLRVLAGQICAAPRCVIGGAYVQPGCSGLVRMRNARMPTDIEQKCARTCGLSRLWIYQTLCVLVCVLEEASTVVLLTPPMSCRKCWILVSCTETLIKSESCRNCAQQSWGKIDAAGAAPVPSRTRLENCSQSSMERQYFGQWNVKSTCNRTDALVFRAEASFATIG